MSQWLVVVSWFTFMMSFGTLCYSDASMEFPFEYQISLSSSLVCVVDGDGAIHLWALRANLRILDYPLYANTIAEPGSGPLHVADEYLGLKFSQVACGNAHACATTAEDNPKHRSVKCWGQDVLGQVKGAEAVGTGVKALCSGAYYSCGLMGEDVGEASGSVVCWGEISEVFHPSSAPFSSLSCGDFTVCAVDQAGSLHCRGDELQSPPSSDVLFSRVSVGSTHACGLTQPQQHQQPSHAETDDTKTREEQAQGGRVRCWGSNYNDPEQHDGLLMLTRKLEHPAGVMTKVSAGSEHTCSVSVSTRNVVCWGWSAPGGCPGGEWRHVVAGHMMTCAVSVHGGLFACWGQHREILEQVNARSVMMTETTQGRLPRVEYFGPMLSGLGHMDGSWLKVLPAGVQLETSPAVHVLWPLFRSVVSAADGFRTQIAASRISNLHTNEDITITVLLDNVVRKTIRARGARVSAKEEEETDESAQGGDQAGSLRRGEEGGEESCVVLDGAVWVDGGDLSVGKHRVTARIQTSSGASGIEQSVTFWASGVEAATHSHDQNGIKQHLAAGRESEAQGPRIEVVRAERARAGASFLRVWAVISGFEVGIDGQVVLNDGDANTRRRISSYSRVPGATAVRFWPRARVVAVRDTQLTGWRVVEVVSEDGDADEGGTGWECSVGMQLASTGVHSDGSQIPDTALSGVLVEMVAAEHWETRSGECMWEMFTLSLEDGDGEPFEGNSQLSQLAVPRACEPGEKPPGRVVPRYDLGLEGMTNVERTEAAERGLNVLEHPHHATASPHADTTCYWYTGPIAGGDEWRELRLGETLDDLVQNHIAQVEAGDHDDLCGFGDALLNVSPSHAPDKMPRIVGFYHVSTVGERWPTVVGRQLKMLRSSPLYNAMHQINVGASGWFGDVVSSLLPTNGSHEKFTFTDHNAREKYMRLGGAHVAREVPTLQLMYEYCAQPDNEDHWVWYMHSKGVGHSWPKFKWTQDWTVYMEAFLFEQPHLCMHALLTGSNACGVELYHHPYLHYAGNFWWTTCRRVRGLEEPDGMLPMTESTWGKPENWIGSSPGGRMTTLFSAYESNPYGTDLPRSAYMPIATKLHHLACPLCAGRDGY